MHFFLNSDEFKDYAIKKPEYAKVFTTYQETSKHQNPDLQLQFSNGHASEGIIVDQASTSSQVDPASKKLQ